MDPEKEAPSPNRRFTCTTCFDALWFCYSPMHQLQQYYRLGVLDNCYGIWGALMDCLTLKTKSSLQVQLVQRAEKFCRLSISSLCICMEEDLKSSTDSDIHQSPVVMSKEEDFIMAEEGGGDQVVEVAVEHDQDASGGNGALEPDNGALEPDGFLDGAVVGCGRSGPGSGSGSFEVIVKRKRGRPRKCYDDHGVAIDMVPPPLLPSLSGSSEKRGRGRPRGTGKLQLLASLGGCAAETAGGSLIPYVVAVHTGEDVVGKILSFAERGPQAVCILSASGVISSVIIRQPSSGSGALRYDGHFEILSLSWSFVYGETRGPNKNGMLSVSLANSDGRVFGGGVAGHLIAAGPIQLIVASFKQSVSRELKRRQTIESSTVASVLAKANIARMPDIIENEENCTTPTSVLLEPAIGEAGKTVTINQKVTLHYENDGNENSLQQQRTPDQGVSAEISNIDVPQI